VTCSIIGGGNSVRTIHEFIGFRIGINYTYKYRDVDITWAQDKSKDFEVIPNFYSLKHHNYKNAVDTYELEGLDFNREPGKLLQANASIITGINLALQLGYKTIYVLGADNKHTIPYHFYSDAVPSSYDIDRQLVHFRTIHKRLGSVTLKEDERLIFVDSTIDHFENITVEEYKKLL